MPDQTLRKQMAFVYGIGTGLLPIAWMILAIPGFWDGYWDRLKWIGYEFVHGATDFPVPIAWPWELRWETVAGGISNRWFQGLQFSNFWAQGASFATLILFYVFSIPAVFKIKKEAAQKNPLFLASVFVGVFYFHHAFSRRDFTHIAEGMFPLISGAMALYGGAVTAGQKKFYRFLMDWILVLSLVAALPLNNLFFEALIAKDKLQPYAMGQDKIWIFKKDARSLDRIKKSVNEHVPKDEALLIAPLLTSLYCVMNKVSPVPEIYFYLRQSDFFHRRTVRLLEEKKVNWALVGDPLTEGKMERKFSVTHALLWEYLMAHFELASTEELWPGYFLLKRIR